MKFDPENPVVRLCAAGMELEGLGDREGADRRFQEAWEIASNDFEAFTAAHYLARNRSDPAEALRWNREALERARGLDGVKEHLPSLCLNLGHSYEVMGEREKAESFYREGADHASGLPAGPYGDMIRSGIAEGLRRVGSDAVRIEGLDELIDEWCERRDLKSLAMILPARVGYLGSRDDIARISSALSRLAATGGLPDGERKRVEDVIARCVEMVRSGDEESV